MTKSQAVNIVIATGVVAAVLLLLGFVTEATSDDPFAYFSLVLAGVTLLPVLWLSSFVLAKMWGFTIFNVFIFVILGRFFNFTREVFKTATIFVYWVGWRQVWFALKSAPADRKPRATRPQGAPTVSQEQEHAPRLLERMPDIKGLLGNRKEKR